MRRLQTIKRRKSEISDEVPAVIYVRMSTDHQRYSIANQTDAILRYAKQHNMKVIQTYADEGKSGLNIAGRKGLSSLIDDVVEGRAKFKAVLVYDVSRWGRFQDADESAYYEYKCKKAGVKIHYCAEQFNNDGSSFSTIVKNLKRAMAGEYSRELSVKIFAGQCRAIRKGFRAGGPAGYGFRRLLIDKDGNPKQILNTGEHKNIVSDKVILVPGPQEECETVRQIFHMFAFEEKTTQKITNILNRELEQSGRPAIWQHATVLNMLKNEKYIGHNVYNKKSKKLKTACVVNPREDWVRANSVFEPLVCSKIFRKAQKLIKEQKRSMSDEDMLNGLYSVYKKHGYLSGPLIDASKNIPTANAYLVRFNSLYAAYELVGFHHNARGRSEEEMLVKLKALYVKHGYLSGGLIKKSNNMPSRNAYLRHFGSLTKAYQLAGYIPGKQRLPNDVLLKKLKALFIRYGYLSEGIINKSVSTPHSNTYRKFFGSLTSAYNLIGFDPDKSKVTNEELIANLKEIYTENGYLSGPLIDESRFPYSRHVYSNRFGSMPDAYALAGYNPVKYGMPYEVMLKRLKAVYERHGYLSGKLIDASEGIPCSRTFALKFGSLRETYKLVGFTTS